MQQQHYPATESPSIRGRERILPAYRAGSGKWMPRDRSGPRRTWANFPDGRSPSHPRKYAGAHSPDPKAPPPRLGRAMVRTPLDYLQPLLRGHSHSRVGKEEEEKREALPLPPSHHFLFSLDSDSASLKWQLGNEGRRRGARKRPSFIFPARLRKAFPPALRAAPS